jgi:hypothetical protein
MSTLALLWKFKNYIGIALVVLIVGGYWLSLKHTISADNKEIAAKDQLIADYKVAIQTQNVAIDRMKQYADNKDAAIASATALSEKMQDTVDAQANEILLRKTNIDQTINTLADCNNELARIKAFMINAEGQFRETK